MEIYCIIDVETSGLSTDKNCILQVGSIITDSDLNVLHTYKSYVRPWEGASIEESAIAINGITEDKYKDAPTEVEAFLALQDLLRKPKYNPPTYVGYNVQFDIGFVKSLCFRNRLHMYGNGMIIDLQMMANDLQGIRKYSLKSTAEHLGVKPGIHDALEDCVASLEIFRRITNA